MSLLENPLFQIKIKFMHSVEIHFGLLDTAIPLGFVGFDNEHDKIMREVSTRYTKYIYHLIQNFRTFAKYFNSKTSDAPRWAPVETFLLSQFGNY